MQFVTHAVQNLPPWSRVRTDALIEAVMQPGLVLTLLNPPQPIAPEPRLDPRAVELELEHHRFKKHVD